MYVCVWGGEGSCREVRLIVSICGKGTKVSLQPHRMQKQGKEMSRRELEGERDCSGREREKSNSKSMSLFCTVYTKQLGPVPREESWYPLVSLWSALCPPPCHLNNCLHWLSCGLVVVADAKAGFKPRFVCIFPISVQAEELPLFI